MNLQNAAETVLKQCMGASGGETLCIVYDWEKEAIAEALISVGTDLGLEVVSVQMPIAANDGAEPPKSAALAMQGADIVLCVTTRSLSHTKARRAASAGGARIASLPGVTEDMLIRTMAADYDAVARRGEALLKALRGASKVQITTSAGTDLTMDITEREPGNDTGLLHRSGSFGNLPAGEVALSPVEGSAQGVLIVDGSMSGAGKLDAEIRIDIREGLAEKISGGRAAQRILDLVEPLGEAARNIAELGIGTNDCAKITGRVLEDEKVMGTIHVALGNNAGMGGTVDVPIHLDGVVQAPTVIVDDTIVLMKDGELQNLV